MKTIFILLIGFYTCQLMFAVLFLMSDRYTSKKQFYYMIIPFYVAVKNTVLIIIESWGKLK